MRGVGQKEDDVEARDAAVGEHDAMRAIEPYCP